MQELVVQDHLSHPYCYKYQLCGKRKPLRQKKDDSHNISSSNKKGIFKEGNLTDLPKR